MMYLFIILSVISAIVGLSYLTGATTGVGLIALGCYCGIIARIVQAEKSDKKDKSGAVPNPEEVRDRLRREAAERRKLPLRHRKVREKDEPDS